MPPKRAKTTAAAAPEATPARNTRGRTNTPLPSLSTRANYSYGSQGMAVLNTQIRSQASGFSEAFQATRNETADRESSPPGDQPPPQDTNAQPARPAQPAGENQQDQAGQEGGVAGRNATAVDAAAEYAGGIRRVAEEMRRHSPSRQSWKLIVGFVLCGLIGLFSGMVAMHLPLSNRMMAARASIAQGMDIAFHQPPFDIEPAFLADIWYHFKHDQLWKEYLPNFQKDVKQSAININFWERLDTFGNRLNTTIADFESRLKKFEDRHDALLLQQYNNLRAEVRDLALQTTNDALEKRQKLTTRELELLRRLSFVEAIYETMNTVNWFSVGLGARIDPSVTSPTKNSPRDTWLASLYRKISPLATPPHPPIAALQKWDEATDCWCGTVNDSNHTQIGVIMNSKIYPEMLIIEHVPAAGTLNIAAAPRKLEFWVDVGTKQEAERFNELVNTGAPWREGYECSEPHSDNWICIGHGDYDIHMDLPQQRFRMWLDTENIGLAVNRVMVRAVSNWGAEWTCFYRLIMRGEKAD